MGGLVLRLEIVGLGGAVAGQEKMICRRHDCKGPVRYLAAFGWCGAGVDGDGDKLMYGTLYGGTESILGTLYASSHRRLSTGEQICSC